MGSSTISLGLGLGGGKSGTSSGRLPGGGGLSNLYSVDFDGTDDYMEVTPSSTIDMYGLSLWFKPDSVINKSSGAQVAFGPSGNFWLPGFGIIAGA